MTAAGQLTLTLDVPHQAPAPKPRSRKPSAPTMPTAEELEALAERRRRERALVDRLDGRGVVVDLLRWQDERRAA